MNLGSSVTIISSRADPRRAGWNTINWTSHQTLTTNPLKYIKSKAIFIWTLQRLIFLPCNKKQNPKIWISFPGKLDKAYISNLNALIFHKFSQQWAINLHWITSCLINLPTSLHACTSGKFLGNQRTNSSRAEQTCTVP